MDFPDYASWEEWKGLALIPNLTHLAFLMQKSFAIFQGALDTCPALQVLVYLYSRVYEAIDLQKLAQDTRFVCMRVSPFALDWQIGAWGRDDFWARAERFIAQRVSGQVDRETFPFETLVILSITVGITLAAGITREAFAFEARSTFVWARTAHGEVASFASQCSLQDVHPPLLDGNWIELCWVEIDNNWISRFLPNAGFVDALHNGNKPIAGTAAWYQTRDEAHAKFKFYMGGFFGLIAERLAGISDHPNAQTRGKGLGHGWLLEASCTKSLRVPANVVASGSTILSNALWQPGLAVPLHPWLRPQAHKSTPAPSGGGLWSGREWEWKDGEEGRSRQRAKSQSQCRLRSYLQSTSALGRIREGEKNGEGRRRKCGRLGWEVKRSSGGKEHPLEMQAVLDFQSFPRAATLGLFPLWRRPPSVAISAKAGLSTWVHQEEESISTFKPAC
ncbi:hypothetical protein DFH08DRAFT_1030489 [Mycena albidolilacea]|uniref:Uncharacterized protein n=1 Tax=Mycena albidolilacea TaxID=1033008 RepID=A0AAD6ZGN1_9AGAR|nr:hypothetical protein DFH08DRAFT_1030489 [Mycena albidolilacea]